ncbi:MAG TPA: DUF2817 domain-containing protein [Spirochaetota bacterium]|nr:DUF2817 domain-containing protein [Spirochaetota bacterium]
MNIKKITILLMILSITFPDVNAGSYKKQSAIQRKAISTYRGLSSSRIKWNILGKSNWKNRIYYKEFGSGKKLTMVIGGMHGDEPSGFLSALKLAQYIEKNPSSIKNRVIIIPCLNPDGLIKWRRTNGHKVDLNRNFPAESWSPEYVKYYNNPGKLPASEPETVLIANAIDDYRPNLIIQMHQPFNTLYPDDKTPQELTEKMSEITGIPISHDIGYATPGSLGSLKSSLEYKVQGITFELCGIDREPDYDKIIESLIEAINY